MPRVNASIMMEKKTIADLWHLEKYSSETVHLHVFSASRSFWRENVAVDFTLRVNFTKYQNNQNTSKHFALQTLKHLRKHELSNYTWF